MVSNRFALWLIFRVGLLALTLFGLGLAITHNGYYVVTLLLLGFSVAELMELYRYVSKTNAELARFLAAARFDDFSQRFDSSHKGAGFEQLNQVFSDIMAQFNNVREQQASQLRQLKSLTEHMPVPLFSLYPDERIQLHNNAARHLFGRAAVNKLGDLTLFGDEFVDAIKTLNPGNRRLVNFCDEDIEHQLTVVMTQVVTGEVSENLISMQDIQSELDAVQLQAWQELVQVLTHEIMNSITPVASLAKTATDLVGDVSDKIHNKASTEEVLEELEYVRKAVDTVARRSDSLTQFVQSYRSLTQMPTPQKQTLCLGELFNQIKVLVGKSIEVTTNVEPPELQLLADEDLIEQVLINLLKNAEQAIGEAGNGQISLTARTNQRGFVVIDVADNGPGIPEDIAKDIFVPFYTTKPTGSGVGLALTRQIMIAHGGNVSLHQSDTGGARFMLVF